MWIRERGRIERDKNKIMGKCGRRKRAEKDKMSENKREMKMRGKLS